ncbi:hypothetical protein K8R33_01750 [archaeon]|nr:hypothetical protein [archaeon]
MVRIPKIGGKYSKIISWDRGLSLNDFEVCTLYDNDEIVSSGTFLDHSSSLGELWMQFSSELDEALQLFENDNIFIYGGDRYKITHLFYGEGSLRTKVPYIDYRALHKPVLVDRLVEMTFPNVDLARLKRGRKKITQVENASLKDMLVKGAVYETENSLTEVVVPYRAYDSLNKPNPILLVTSVTPRHEKLGPRR